MTRISKKDRLKNCPRKRKPASEKTGPKKDNLNKGFKEHANCAQVENMFIPKIA